MFLFVTTCLQVGVGWGQGKRKSSTPVQSSDLKVQVSNLIDQVEQQEGRREEDTGVRVQLRDVDVDAASPPGARLALFVAAKEALAVFAIQTLVDTGVLKLLPVHGIV